MIVLPAVDVVDGRAVRLVQGRAGSESEYGSAVDAALAWQRDGAEWIHLVDIDAAFGRGPTANCWPKSWANSTFMLSCRVASATTSRWQRRWPPGAPGSTWAPRRWKTRNGAPR
ncbi:phosphoribosyl isomerase A [Mycobacterium xenopi 3993]|nr:phosphoribosyl isomerase A [Mycobacterium xenopi 3993]